MNTDEIFRPIPTQEPLYSVSDRDDKKHSPEKLYHVPNTYDYPLRSPPHFIIFPLITPPTDMVHIISSKNIMLGPY